MSRSITSKPDVLVLGAGGTLGIAWLRGVIDGIESASRLDLSACEYFVGTSAGSLVASHLAARVSLGSPIEVQDAAASPLEQAPGSFRRAAASGLRVAAAATAPLMPLALKATRAPGEVARAALLRTARGAAREMDLSEYTSKLGSFDGRLRIVTVDRSSGRRVVFGAPGAPSASVAEAVLASCAVPWLFAPVDIGGREYVDGGVWSMSNLDAAPVGRRGEVLALLPTFGRSGKGAAALLRAAGQAAGLAELQILRARGVRVRIVAPDAAAVEAIGPSLMDPGPRAAVAAAGRAQGVSLGTKS